MEGRSNKGILSAQVSPRDMAILTQGCVGCLHCSVTKHTGLFEGEEKKMELPLSTSMTTEQSINRAGAPSIAQTFYSLDCTIW